MAATYVHLHETSVLIEADDGRWVDLIAELWRPLLSPDPGPDMASLTIRTEPPGWSASIDGSAPATADDPWYLLSLIRILIAERVTKHSGLVLVHGGLIAREERASLLVGPSGAGKSTLTVALSSEGWEYGGDEVVGVTPGNRIIPLPMPPKVETMNGFPPALRSWTPAQWLPRPSDGFTVPLDRFVLSKSEVHPAWLVFVRFESKTLPRLERLTPARAVASVAEQTFGLNETSLAGLTRLCRGVPAVAITYGNTADARELIESLETLQ